MDDTRLTHRDWENPERSLARSPYLRDIGALTHSSSFRRLANKAQVYLNPNLDFPRTRLSHSLEVAQLGRQLARHFSEEIAKRHPTAAFAPNDFENLVEAACLAHDIGHPAFGHAGEHCLNKEMVEALPQYAHTGTKLFCANRQTLAILLGSPGRESLNVTRSLLDAVSKYKDRALFGEKAPAAYGAPWSDLEKLSSVSDSSGTGTGLNRHPACYLMEAADDIAYISGDLEDAIKFGVLSRADEAHEVLVDRLGKIMYQGAAIAQHARLKRDLDPYQVSRFLIKALVAHVCRVLSDIATRTCNLNELPAAMAEFVQKQGDSQEKANLLFCMDSSQECKPSYISEIKSTVIHGHILQHEFVKRNEVLAQKAVSGLWKELLFIGALPGRS